MLKTQVYPKKITLSNGLILIKDHYVYEVYYKNVYMGYFILERFKNAIKEIIVNGFYDGRNYDMRINNVNERGVAL